MRVIPRFALVVSGLALTAPANADTWPLIDGPMEHVFVAFDGSRIDVTLENPGNLPLPMLNHGETYTPPAAALDGKGYSSQFGWLVNGTWSPPAGTSVWVRLLDQTPGLDTYAGGMRSMATMHSYNPLFVTGGADDKWQWSGTMVHNWYAASLYGDYEATYEVYLGNSVGTPDPGYGADTVTLSWTYVPEPGSLTLLGLAGLLGLRRR